MSASTATYSESTITLENEILALGSEIFHEAQKSSLSIFNAEFYTGKLINWAMEDEEFKISLFRFVDVLPTLTTSELVIRHAQEYFQPVAHRIPDLLQWGLNISPTSITAKVAAQLIRKQIRTMAERFILGETPNEALKALRKIRKDGFAFTVDLLGEETVGEKEARAYQSRYVELLETLAKEVPTWAESSALVAGHRGEETPINISVKLSALYSQVKAVASEHVVDVLTERLSELLVTAKRIGAFVYLDMEDTKLTSITLETFRRICISQEFINYPRLGIVLQAYLRRTEQDLTDVLSWLKKRETPIGVRLVKGAYWDTETILAKQRGWEIPVWQEKISSDACYERLSLTLLENSKLIMPAFGSHNIRSLVHAIKVAELFGLDQTQYELQALYGMAEPIKRTLADRGYLVREYAPIGELLPGMGYLVRRLLENTSNEGFLRLGFRDNETPETLLKKPISTEAKDSAIAYLAARDRRVFKNCALTDYSLEEERLKLLGTIKSFQSEINLAPKQVLPIINGKEIKSSTVIALVSPENTALKVANVHLASIEESEEAMKGLDAYFSTWRDTTISERATILQQAADLMESRRAELNAIIITEAGKPWLEADADVAEAIDFLRYYAVEAEKLFAQKKLGIEPGEENYYMYEARGVTTVISPWNFPLAIPCGMFAAALVCGNCVILKPAEQSSLIAQVFFKLMLEAGMPASAAAFLPAYGEDVGAYLVKHPKTSTIAFTGSKEVGLSILRTAAEAQPGQEHIKRVIAEMGGKNAIIVDDDADLDEAVQGVLYSAFGFAGQKCSACSRVIVLETVYESFIERIAEATKSIDVGPASLAKSYLGPVIDKEAQQRLIQSIETFKQQLSVAAEANMPAEIEKQGYYVKPIIFRDVPHTHALFTQELFGPVLALTKASTFDEAISIALNSEYGLTGGVFSRSPQNIALATRKFRVGNLYLNRNCTGALVYRQPFGGAKMSGVGSKAGGPDYLLQFVIPRVVTENTMRRGFAPQGVV